MKKFSGFSLVTRPIYGRNPKYYQNSEKGFWRRHVYAKKLQGIMKRYKNVRRAHGARQEATRKFHLKRDASKASFTHYSKKQKKN